MFDEMQKGMQNAASFSPASLAVPCSTKKSEFNSNRMKETQSIANASSQISGQGIEYRLLPALVQSICLEHINH